MQIIIIIKMPRMLVLSGVFTAKKEGGSHRLCLHLFTLLHTKSHTNPRLIYIFLVNSHIKLHIHRTVCWYVETVLYRQFENQM